MSVLFGSSSKEKDDVLESVAPKNTKAKSTSKDTETVTTKKEAKALSVENIETSSISKEETVKTKEKSSLLTSFLDKKKNIEASPDEKQKEEKATASTSVAIKEKPAEKVQEKKSFLGSLFGKKKAKEDITESTSSKSIRNEKVSISEPVKATPIPQRKIANEKKLSTFGLSKERDQFIENLSMLVMSGMSIIGALSSIIKQTKSPGMKLILERMLLEIESGSPVWKALDKTKFFKGYTISLIRLGEESGNFAENLKVVALEEEKDREFKSKVKSALMYPIFVLGLTGIVGIGISWFILPKLAKIFYDLKLALPLITRVLLAFGLFLNKHGLVAVPLASVVIGGFGYVTFGWNKTKFIGEAIIFSIPGIKSLLMEVEVARFGYLLGTLLEAGLPVTKAIDSLASASEVIRYKKFYLALRESIDAGNSFEKSFNAYKNINALIPPPVQQLIISGEQSGNLNKTLIKVGQVLEAKSDTTTKNLTIIMEPILLVIVWAGVVSVAFAVILPIYSLVGGLNNIK
jgi:type II secretory pathway component PulF